MEMAVPATSADDPDQARAKMVHERRAALADWGRMWDEPG